MGFFVTFSIAIIYLLSASVGVAESSLRAPKTIKSESSCSCKSQVTTQQKICKKVVLDFLWIQNNLLFSEDLVSLATISKEDVKQIHPRTLRVNSGLSPPV